MRHFVIAYWICVYRAQLLLKPPKRRPHFLILKKSFCALLSFETLAAAQLEHVAMESFEIPAPASLGLPWKRQHQK